MHSFRRLLPNRGADLTLDAVLAWTGAFAVALLTGALFGPGVARKLDLRAFYAAGSLLRQHPAQLYNLAAQHAAQAAFSNYPTLPFYHLSYEALLYLPLTYLTYSKAYMLSLAWNMLLLAACYLFAPRAASEGMQRVPRPLLFLAFFPIWICLIESQNSILFLLLACLTWGYLESGRDRAAGLLLGLAIFKLQLVLPIVILLAARRGLRLLGGFLAGSSAMLLLSTLLVGPRAMLDLAHLLRAATLERSTSQHAEELIGVFPQAMGSLYGFLYGCGARFLAAQNAFRLNAVLSILLFAGCLYLVRRVRSMETAFSIALLCGLLICHHLYIYDYTLLLLPILLLRGRWLGRIVAAGYVEMIALFAIAAFGALSWSALIPLALLAQSLSDLPREPRLVPLLRRIHSLLRSRGAEPTLERMLLWAGAGILLVLMGSIFSHGVATALDFRAFYAAGHLLRHNPGQLYSLPAQKATEATFSTYPLVLPFYHPAYEALLYVPFSLLSFRAAYLAYIVWNLVLLAACFLLTSFPASEAIRRAPRLMLFLLFYPVFLCIMHGQNALLFLLLASLTWICLERGEDAVAGLLLGIALFKPQLVLPIAILLTARKGLRFLTGFLIGSGAVALLSALLIGQHGVFELAHLLLKATLQGNNSADAQGAIGVIPSSMGSLYGLLYTCGARFLSAQAAFRLYAVLAALLLLACLYLVRRVPRDATAFSISILCAVLISPHLYLHEYTLLLLPIFLLEGKLLGRIVAASYAAMIVLFLSNGAIAFAWAALIPIALLVVSLAGLPRGDALQARPEPLQLRGVDAAP